MIESRGLHIDATCEQIINQLKMDIADTQGRSLFSRTKSLSSNMQFSCPFHSNGQERNPSCGMRRDAVYSGSKVVEAGTVHCFTCGYTGDLQDFISKVFGKVDGGMYGNQWLKKNFLGIEEVIRKTPDFGFDKRSKKSAQKTKEKEYNYVSENELELYRYWHDYMFERGLNEDVIFEYDVGYDVNTESLTFPVRDLEGRTVFINRRGVKGKFHSYGENDPKTDFVYGLYELYNSDWKNEPVYITESIIDCLSFRVNGYYAVALMGLGGGQQYQILKDSKIPIFIAALDPDKSGMEATEKLIFKLKKDKLISKFKYPRFMYDEELDINDVVFNLRDIIN